VAYALSDYMKNYRPWMTLKVTDSQYGRLSLRQLGCRLQRLQLPICFTYLLTWISILPLQCNLISFSGVFTRP